MTDPTTFETRLTDALRRYADRVPTEVDATRLVRALVSVSTSSSIPRRAATGRGPRFALAVVVLIALTLTGVVLFGGRLLGPVPPVVISPSPSTAPVTPSPTGTTASPTPLPSPPPAAVLRWTEQDIGTQPAITSIWRVGEWFIAVGPDSSFADDDKHVDAQFVRSRDGLTWESVPAPARGMEVETGTVEGGVLWIVGRRGSSTDPTRGIWTTRDGATWQRVADVTGLDFGPGRVDELSHARNGWLALARKWIDAETQDGFMLRSSNAVRWVRQPYPDATGPYDVAGLVSDGSQWLMATQGYDQGKPASLEALMSDDGVTWTSHVVEVMPQPGSADAVTFGPSGFVIVGQILDGEYPHPRAWASRDGVTWTSATMVGLPDLGGETGLRSVVAFDGGYLASGYRLDTGPSYWTSADGSSWHQVDDGSGSEEASVRALAASDGRYVAGGETGSGEGFIWTAPN